MVTTYHTQCKMYNSVALLLWYIQVFLHPEIIDFLPIYFQHILSISGKSYLFLMDKSIFVCTSEGQKSRVEVIHANWKKVSICVCHFPIGILGQVWYLIVSIPDLCTLTYFGTFFQKHVVLQLIHIYINST